ncbi:MAG: hypothetical protein IJ984_08425, partial [Prevotella sp.]|nr:hypothetical protein [Prevotella sp.]
MQKKILYILAIMLLAFSNLTAQSLNEPQDVTGKYINNPNFTTNNSSWTGAPTVGGIATNRCAEKYNCTFDVYQDLNGLPNGIYSISVQGFYRPGAGGTTSTARNAMFYADVNGAAEGGETSVPLMHINTYKQTNKLYDDDSKITVDGNDYFVPFSMNGASTFFTAGHYQGNVLWVEVKNGTLRIGIKKNVEVNYDWTIFDSFKLTYYGTAKQGTYFLRNRQTGQYLYTGNRYGTEATLAETGLDVTTSYKNGSHSINTGINNKYLRMTPDGNRSAFMDMDEKGLEVHNIEGKYFTISETGSGSYLTTHNGSTVIDFTADDCKQHSAHWQFLTLNDLKNELSSASSSNPMNATFFIRGYGFSKLDNRNWGDNGWKGSPAIGGENSKENGDKYCGDNKNATFDVYQNLSNLPNGTYILSAQAFSSEGTTSYLYADNSMVAVPLITAKGDPRPSDQAAAGKTFAEGWYHTNPVIVHVTDGNMRVGIKGSNNKWTAFDSFHLTYLGTQPISNPYTGATATYYIQNVATGEYLQGGDGWGARPTLGNGIEFGVEKVTDGVYNLYSGIKHTEGYLCDEGYIDHGRTKFIIQEVSAGIYTIATTTYHCNNLDKPANNGQMGRLLTVGGTSIGNIPFSQWSGTGADATVIKTTADNFSNNIGNKNITHGDIIFGDGNVSCEKYADITGYKTMRIKGTPGTYIQIRLNRRNNNSPYEGDTEQVEIGSDGWCSVDLTKYTTIHLNSIKHAYQSPIVKTTIEAVILYKENGSMASFIGGTNASAKEAQWRFVTEAQRIADLSTGSMDNPKEATFMVKGASFTRGDTRHENGGSNGDPAGKWTTTGHWFYVYRDDGAGSDGAAGIVNSQATADDVYQTITGLPNGFYEVSAQGCYRNFTDAVLYANTMSVPFDVAGSEFDDCMNKNHSDCSCRRVASVQTYGTDNYKKTLRVNVTDGTLRLGIKGNKSNDNNLFIFDNFRLVYHGEVEQTDYYIRNVATKEFVRAGLDYEAKLIRDKWGLLMRLFKWEENMYSIDTQISNGSNYNFINTGGYADGAETIFTLNQLNNGYYTISSGTSYMATNEANNSVDFVNSIDAANTYAQWELLTREQLITELKNSGASDANPKDATFFIQSPNLGRHDQRTNADNWKGIDFSSAEYGGYAINYEDFKDGDYKANLVIEKFNKNFDTYQTITGLPSGVYELEVQAFYNQSGEDIIRPFVYAKLQDGTVIGQAPIMSKNNDDIDNLEKAALAIRNGDYKANEESHFNKIRFVVTEDNATVQIGVKKNKLTTNDWTVFDNFKLTYLGEPKNGETQILYKYEIGLEQALYLKNFDNGRYVTGGNGGYIATLGDLMDEHSTYEAEDTRYKEGVRETEFKFTAIEADRVMIQTDFGTNGYLVKDGNNKVQLNGQKEYFRIRWNGTNKTFYIIHVTDNVSAGYEEERFLRNNDKGLGFGSSGNSTTGEVGLKPGGKNFQWVFQTKEDLLNEFSDATADNPVDATFLLRGTAFHKDDSRNSAWTGKPVVGGAESNYVGSVSGRTFDISQKLTGVPNGVYEYTLQGYYITADGTINTNARYYVSTDGMSFIARNTNDMPAVINGKNYTSATQPTLVWQQDFTTGNIIPEIGKDYGVVISDKVYNVGADIGTITINGIAINSNFGLQIKTTWLQRYTDKGQKGLYSNNGGYRSIGIANLKAGQIIRIKTSDTDAFSAANNVVQLDMTLANDGEVTFRAIKDGNGGISVKRYTYIYNVAVYNEVSSSTDVNISNIADAATLIANENGTHPVIRFKVENGTIILGAFNIMKAENTSLYMDNVRLTYLGPDATGYGTPIDIEQGLIHKYSRYYDLAEKDGNLTLNRTTYKVSDNKTTMSDDAMVKHPYKDKWIQHTPQYEETIYAMAGQDLKIVMPNSYTSEAQSSAKFYQRFYNFQTDGLLTENAATNGTFSFNNNATVRKEMRVYEGVAAAPAGGWLFGNRWNNQMVSKFNFKTPTTFTDTIMIGVDHSDFTDIGDMGMFGNLTEPTLTQRLVYYIHPASEMVEKLSSCTGDKYLEVKSISFPTIWHGQNMNKADLNAVALDLQLKNYFTNATKVPVAKDFEITIDDGGTGITLATDSFSSNTDRFISFNYPTGGVVNNYKNTAYIYVKSNGKNIAKFILDFVPNTELRPWKDIMGRADMRRSPIYLEQHAILMEQMNFDRHYNSIKTDRSTWPVGDVTAINGIEEDRYVSSYDQFNHYPLNFDQTSFAAYYPNAIWGQYSVMKSVRIPSWTDVRSFKDINQLYHDHYTQLGNVVQTEKYKGDGYFMYIDASNFPSSVATLNIDEELCDGTTIHFSGWVSAMAASTSTSDAPGYLLFSIVGKKSDGTQETIESFCPGPIRADAMDYNGTRVTADTYNNDIWGNASRSIWQQFAFSFVIKSEVAGKYSSYALKIDNYCSNTTGGDMMVDDVRLYIQKAVPDIMQTAPICNPNGANDFKVYTTFEQLLDAVNKEEATSGGETAYAWYTFIDNSIYAANLNQGTAKAFEAARIKTIGENGYFKFTFSTHYDSNDGSAFNAKKEDILSPDGTTERRINLNPNISYGNQEAVLNTLPYYLDGSSGSPTPGWVTGIDTETIYGDGFKVECNRYTDLSSYDELRIYQVSGAPVRCFFYNKGGVDIVTVIPKEKRNNYWVININDILNTYEQAKLIAIKGNASGVKANVSNIIAYKRGLEPNKQYQIVFHATTDNIESISDPKTFFNLESQECASMAMFDIISGNITRFDGINSTDDNNFCEGQIATIKVEMQGVVDNTTVQKENLFYDWWAGDKESLTTELKGKNYSAWDVLNAFRTQYPEAEAYNGEDFVYKEDLLNLLAPKGKLHLYKTALNVKVEKPENSQMKVTVIPLQSQMISFDGYCDQPSEIVLNVNSKAPTALDGFKKATYPDYMQEVLLRIGLEQIKEVTADASNEKALFIPLRQVALSGTGGYSTISVQKKSDAENFAAVYLAETNDPEMISYNKVNDNLEMRYVGKMHKIENSATSNNYEDYVQLTFNSDFKPKEGYRYTLKTSFIEQDASSNTNTCNGDLLIPMYIVPEYQVWTGGAGNNDWTNDRNWRRADNSELNNGETKYTDAGRLTNKQNTTSNGLVPMNFTNVLMQTADGTGNTYTSLSAIEAKSDGILNLTSSTTHTKDIEYHLAADRQKPTVTGWSPNDNQVYCVPFYTNTCDEINFAPSSQMLNTYLLNYNKAWVEYALESKRWYALSSPLQGVVSGDMYLPRNTAKQNTAYFYDINYDNTNYSRLKPAVYQQAWDKAEATIYRLERDQLINKTPPGLESETATANVARAFNWSKEYNDVKVPFGINGFSVRVDVTDIVGYNKEEGKRDVLLRLPKADNTYNYYMGDDETNGSKTDNLTTLRNNAGKLFTDDMKESGDMTVTLTNNSNDNEYYLVGNPFMSALDLDKFFDNNTSLDRTYWILTSSSYTTGVENETQNWLSTDETTTGEIAPLQAFFVRKTDGKGGELKVIFTKDMAVAATGDVLMTRSTPSHTPTLRITAMRNGMTS